VPASLPRAEFSHWVLVDVAATVTEVAEGADSDGVTAHGKPTGATDLGVRGKNDYTGWFAGDADMEGTYGGYDGPCPPWNDELVHRYTFTVYALDVDSLGSPTISTSPRRGHRRGTCSHRRHIGTYTLDPAVGT
jgi:phosphatidylethanolamine-binding protein (PEBP) family uncharacterized protein